MVDPVSGGVLRTEAGTARIPVELHVAVGSRIFELHPEAAAPGPSITAGGHFEAERFRIEAKGAREIRHSQTHYLEFHRVRHDSPCGSVLIGPFTAHATPSARRRIFRR